MKKINRRNFLQIAAGTSAMSVLGLSAIPSKSFGAKKNETVNESKGSASKAVASTQKPKEVIQEGSALRDRFKKLANIL